MPDVKDTRENVRANVAEVATYASETEPAAGKWS